MEDYQIRVVEEREELQEKINKLVAFNASDAFKKIDTDQRSLLKCQLLAMETYNQILKERIDRF